jgi:glycosidase
MLSKGKLLFLILLSILFTGNVSWSYGQSIPKPVNEQISDLQIKEVSDRWIFGNSKISLELSKVNGEWLSLKHIDLPGNIIYPVNPITNVDFRIDDVWMVEKYGATLLESKVNVDQAKNRISLEMVFGVLPRPPLSFIPERWKNRTPLAMQSPAPGSRYEFTLTSIYTLYPGQSRIDRLARLARLPSNNIMYSTFRRLEGFLFQLPGPSLGEPKDCTLQLSGPLWRDSYIYPGKQYSSITDRFVELSTAPDRTAGLVNIRNEQRKLTLSSWLDTKGEVAYYTYLSGDGFKSTILHYDMRALRLSERSYAESDIHRIEITTGPLSDALKKYREMAEQRMPINLSTPKWAREMTILEVMPSYFPNGLKGLMDKLEFYKGVGFNTIYLMPHWVGGYVPIDPFTVDPKFGTKEDLKLLVKRAHSLGMRVIFDMVIHGFAASSPLVREHPEFFSKNENGLLVPHHVWPSINTDPTNPGYQQYMIDLVLHDIKEYDIDGYRIDANTFKMPNWEPNLGYPAWKGGNTFELQKRMYEAMQRVKPDTVILSEIFGPVWHSLSNLVHDSSNWASAVALEKMQTGEINAEIYKSLMANTYDVLQKGANRVYFARNHDTSWFGKFGGYTPRFKALDAIHVFMTVPEFFAGDPENPPFPDKETGLYDYYRKLFSFRTKYPELLQGDVLLREIESDNPWIFTGMKQLDGQTSVVIVSLSEKEEHGRISIKLPVKHSFKNLKLIDPIANETQEISVQEKTNSISVRMKPFQVLVGRI